VTQERWAHAAEVFVTSGQVQAPPPLADGTFWTNKYIVNVPGA